MWRDAHSVWSLSCLQEVGSLCPLLPALKWGQEAVPSSDPQSRWMWPKGTVTIRYQHHSLRRAVQTGNTQRTCTHGTIHDL